MKNRLNLQLQLNSFNGSRRRFMKQAGTLAGGAVLAGADSFAAGAKHKPLLAGHLWVYASRYPPNWDCTPILDTVFNDFKYAGFQGIEIMESLLHHYDAVQRFNDLIGKYNLPVIGTSYYNDMWLKSKHADIAEDAELTVSRLAKIGAAMIGLTVGDAHRKKTEEELDAQADMLKTIIKICAKYKVQPNMHNHTFEMADGMHDFKGTIARVPEMPLGPDINWLVRGGVDPVWYIKTYGHKMVFMHLRNQDANGKWTETLSDGVTDFRAIAKALKAVHYKGKAAAVELAFDEPPKNEVREDLKRSRDYVKEVFGW